MDIINACRICLQFDDCMSSIYQTIVTDSQPITLMDLFDMIPRLNITDSEGMPTYICSKCLDDTMQIYTFILKCERANQMLTQQQVDRKLEKENIIDLTTNDQVTPTASNSYEPSSCVESPRSYEEITDTASENNVYVMPDEIDEYFAIPRSSSQKITTNVGRRTKLQIQNPDVYQEDIKPDIREIDCANKLQSYPMKITINKIKTEEVEIGEETIHKPQLSFLNETQPEIKSYESKHSDSIVSKCSNCGQVFETSSSYAAHTESCLPLFECAICSKAFQDETSIALHFLNTHPYEKPRIYRANIKSVALNNSNDLKGFFLQCPKCPKSFATERKLVGHLKGHSLRYYCEPCKKSFRNNSHLNAHRLRKHKVIIKTKKNITCGLCDLRFAAKSELRQHQLVHTKEKPYECPKCDIKYAYKKLLVDHIRLSHDMPEHLLQKFLEEKYKALSILVGSTFSCYICAAQVDRDDLAAHFNSHKK